jgi:type VI secretion system protein ImpB
MASADSATRFIKRNRPPRVQISYEDPYDSQRQIELPFVMGVMSDLSGNASQVEKPPVDERKFADVDMDNVDKYMDSIKPAASFRVDNKLTPDSGEKMGINLTFRSMEDFTPAGIAKQVPALKALLEAREQLSNLQKFMDGKVAAEAQLKKLLTDPEMMKALEQRKAESPTGGGEEKTEDNE